MVVRAVRFDDIPTLARIHHQALSDDFLPSLGRDYLENVYYPASLLSDNASTFGFEKQGRVVGFVTIAQDSNFYTRDVLNGRYIKTAFCALRAAFKNPFHLLRSAEVLHEALFSSADPIKAEIVYIAVDENHRRCGLGKMLVTAALVYLDQKGISTCRTKTLASNSGVISMYERLGWGIRNYTRLLGRQYVILVTPNSG